MLLVCELAGLKEYQYKPAGYTVLDELHQPFWNYIANNLLPDWLAPNLITLLGLSALLLAYVLNAVYLPEFAGDAPRWLYFLNGTAALFYLHMDCLDGKQARRTKTSSPLGQLFDHGCDALAVHLLIAPLASSLNTRFDSLAVISTFTVQVLFILAHWEEYHTGVMVYGGYYFGVTEANHCVVAVHYFSFLFGGRAWHFRPFAAFLAHGGLLVRTAPAAFPLQAIAQLRLWDLLAWLIVALALVNIIPQLHRVFRLAETKQLERTTLPKSERGQKTLGRGHALRHIAEISTVFLLGAMLVLLPASAPGQQRVQVGTFGVMYALQSTRLIMAHMCKDTFNVAIWPMIAITCQIVNSWTGIFGAMPVACAVNMVVVVGYLHYVVAVVNEICAFLKIPCLTISSRLNAKSD